MSAIPLVAVAASGAAAAGQAAPTSPGLVSAFFGLVLVLALVLGLAWLLKRLPGAAQGLRQSDQLRVVSMLAVGTKERLVVVQVGNDQLLLGVCAGGISTLHVLPEPLVLTPPPALPDFAAMLAKRLRKET